MAGNLQAAKQEAFRYECIWLWWNDFLSGLFGAFRALVRKTASKAVVHLFSESDEVFSRV